MFDIYLLERSRIRPSEWLISDKVMEVETVDEGLGRSADWMTEMGVSALEAYNAHSEDGFGIMITSPGVHFALIINEGVLVEDHATSDVFNGSLIVGNTDIIEA